jgi:SAM-dependent methyltransferase
MTLADLLKRCVLFPEATVRRIVSSLASMLPRADPTAFGLREALLYGNRLDGYERYGPLVDAILKEGQDLRVLDVGAGGPGVAAFLKGFASRDRIFVVDRLPVAVVSRLVRDKQVTAVVADACGLPFRDETFDVTVAADSLEHIPRSRRGDYCAELRRVARRRVILHCPTEGGNGRYLGAASDQRFQRWYRRLWRKDEANIAEHMAFGLPSPNELATLFPGARIEGRQNADVWLRYMQLERIPYLRLLAGVVHWLFFRPQIDRPPFYGALVSWTKPGR